MTLTIRKQCATMLSSRRGVLHVEIPNLCEFFRCVGAILWADQKVGISASDFYVSSQNGKIRHSLLTFKKKFDIIKFMLSKFRCNFAGKEKKRELSFGTFYEGSALYFKHFWRSFLYFSRALYALCAQQQKQLPYALFL